MPEEQHPQTERPEDAALIGLPEAQAEQRYKTLAVRVDESLHAQLRFIAQLNGANLSDEIRRALEARVTQAYDDPELIARAENARSEIEREAAARAAALAGFLAKPAVEASVAQPQPPSASTRSRRATAKTVGE